MGTLLKVDRLVKTYGSRAAVDGLSFEVGAGEIYGLLGPNGAGKTTTVKTIAGLLRPSSGTVTVAGLDPYLRPLEAKAHLGWVGQETSLYDDLSAEENLRLACALARVPRRATRSRVEALLEMTGLSGRSDERVAKFSGGMKRRLHLAVALVHKPDVLLLDEPLVGIDPQARAYLTGVIERLAAEGHAVLLTTHDMDDAERLSNRVGILDEGHLLAEGTVDELRARLGERDIVRVTGAFGGGVPELDGPVEILSRSASELAVAVSRGPEALPRVLAAIERGGGHVDRVVLERPSLETLFLKLTGRELRD